MFVWVSARVVPAIALLPAFGGHALPWSLRLGMGAALSVWMGFGFTSAAFSTATTWLPSEAGGSMFLRVLLIALGELAIGVAFAWLASLVFAAVEMAGRLVDVARRADGSALLTPVSSQPGEETTPMSALYTLLAALVFAEAGGPGHLVAALVRSYEIFPLGGNVAPHLQERLLPLVAETMAGSIEVAVGLAAPVLLAIWLAELFVALAARLVGRSGGMEALLSAATPLLGLGVVLLSLGILRAAIEGWLFRIPGLLLRTSQLWGHG